MSLQMTIQAVRVPISTPTLWPHTATNSYLIGNAEESVLVDAGYDHPSTRAELEKAVQEHGLARPSSIIFTHHHPDHVPGVRQLTDWQLAFYCHERDKRAISGALHPQDELRTLADEETIQVGGADIRILHTPGHTAGHLSLYIPSEKILIAGDNILSEGTTWIGPPDGNMRDYLRSLERLKQLDLEKLGPGHGTWVTDPYERIDFVITRRLHREEQIQQMLSEHGQLTAYDLTKYMYEGYIHPSVFGVAQKTTEAHLVKLMEDGAVVQQGSAYSLQSICEHNI
ncbi:MBL fold metallo-hydrolase [Bacillus thermotolerans]|uniref:Beta-lactamase-like protein n=1 Tax=Bacillus thermotolerans TaxID=1221996 RepID=A0A0F5I0W9_BACTR|nr:MBL fold metallo-hydrolase [Bacillus thermotolerans]KKB38737.1 Beta-lactamase-like protein [Bacillus thermotolerans]KKB41318.1 beta-lactamase-like protein [Bacillus thermotolerans]KKB44029.1 Beta-lactamase-like protein [Bacillus thermotolerans]